MQYFLKMHSIVPTGYKRDDVASHSGRAVWLLAHQNVLIINKQQH